MELIVGQKYRYKLSVAPGRPFVGEVMQVSDDLVRMKTRQGNVISVSQELVTGPYTFKPYNTKKRQEAEPVS